jgi:hypothetical protein
MTDPINRAGLLKTYGFDHRRACGINYCTANGEKRPKPCDCGYDEAYAILTADVTHLDAGVRSELGVLRLALRVAEEREHRLRQQGQRLRDAIRGLVGTDDPEELNVMEAAILVSGVPTDDKATTVAAIQALRETR